MLTLNETDRRQAYKLLSSLGRHEKHHRGEILLSSTVMKNSRAPILNFLLQAASDEKIADVSRLLDNLRSTGMGVQLTPWTMMRSVSRRRFDRNRHRRFDSRTIQRTIPEDREAEDSNPRFDSESVGDSVRRGGGNDAPPGEFPHLVDGMQGSGESKYEDNLRDSGSTFDSRALASVDSSIADDMVNGLQLQQMSAVRGP